MTMTMTELAVTTQNWTFDRAVAIGDWLLPTDATDDADPATDTTRLTAWVVVIGLMVIAAAAAWAVCLKHGYRGFTGEVKLHTKWKIPVGIKLECY